MITIVNQINTVAVNTICDICKRHGHFFGQTLKGLAQAKIIKKSVILFRVLNMTI